MRGFAIATALFLNQPVHAAELNLAQRMQQEDPLYSEFIMRNCEAVSSMAAVIADSRNKGASYEKQIDDYDYALSTPAVQGNWRFRLFVPPTTRLVYVLPNSKDIHVVKGAMRKLCMESPEIFGLNKTTMKNEQ